MLQLPETHVLVTALFFLAFTVPTEQRNSAHIWLFPYTAVSCPSVSSKRQISKLHEGLSSIQQSDCLPSPSDLEIHMLQTMPEVNSFGGGGFGVDWATRVDLSHK